MSSKAIFGSYVLSHAGGVQSVLRDRWVLIEGPRIAAVTSSRPLADEVHDRPGRFVLPGLMNLHNHCFSEQLARTHTEDGNGRKNNKSIVYTILMPLSRRGIEKDQRAIAIERSEIEHLAKDRDDERAILERSFFARIKELLLGQKAGSGPKSSE